MFLVWQTWLCQGWFSHSVTWEFVVACSVKVWKEGEMACNLAPEWWGPKWMMKMARTQYPIWVAIVIYSVICNKVTQKINLCSLYSSLYVTLGHLGKKLTFNPEITKILLFENCEFVKNETLKMWILWKMRHWKCELRKKWDNENVNFVKNEPPKWDSLEHPNYPNYPN